MGMDNYRFFVKRYMQRCVLHACMDLAGGNIFDRAV